MDFEALLGEAKELQGKLVDLEAKIRKLLDLPQETDDIEIDFRRDGVSIEQSGDKAERTTTLEELLEAVEKNKVQDICCEICNQRLCLGQEIATRVPSIKQVVCNGKQYHAVCINLWLTQ